MLALRGPKTYELEPWRRPDAIVNAKEPYNSEPRPSQLIESFITPIDFFYKRNHGPIPIIESEENYHLQIGGLVPNPIELTLSQIKSLPRHTIIATLQCAGNRRTEMSLKKAVKGVGWGLAALGNAEWAGARLADVLALTGIPIGTRVSSGGGRHVEFVSVDACKEENDGPYKASVPLYLASYLDYDVILAYEMNGQPLTRDHGSPLRAIVPGVIGARSVKWIQSIVVRSDECQGFFQQLDYKMFPNWIDWHNVDFSTRRPIMDFPIQSAICEPTNGAKFPPGKFARIAGYAISGSGRGIERVDVSVEGGLSWSEATRLPFSGPLQGGHKYVSDDNATHPRWAWMFWEIQKPVSPPCQILVRAVDESCNVQPESSDPIWNLRGVLNNAWHSVSILLDEGSGRDQIVSAI